jgi:hypothetical protein
MEVKNFINPLKTLTKMAKVTWSAGIDNVSGALAKPGSNPQHSCEKMLMATHRTAPTENPNCNRLYLRKKTKIKVSQSSRSLNARARFTAVREAVELRKTDLQKITQDKQAFEAQKNTAGGKKTMKAYLWKVCGDEYDAVHSNG